jgi:hypothetical protein
MGKGINPGWLKVLMEFPTVSSPERMQEWMASDLSKAGLSDHLD